MSIDAINTYREPAGLFISGGGMFKSAKGTTRGDPLAMGMYAISLQPLITWVNVLSNVCLLTMRVLWDLWKMLSDGRNTNENGPNLGYFCNAKKMLANYKALKRRKCSCFFSWDSDHHLWARAEALGCCPGLWGFLEEYKDWVSQIVKLAEFAASDPQPCYAAFTIGICYRWTYFFRTRPDIEELLEPLECAIADILIPPKGISLQYQKGSHCTTNKSRRPWPYKS